MFQNNIEFNYAIFVNIIYINNNFVLHIIDKVTNYQTAK